MPSTCFHHTAVVWSGVLKVRVDSPSEIFFSLLFGLVLFSLKLELDII